jgi:hypothetical protein
MTKEQFTIPRLSGWEFLGEIKVEIECDPTSPKTIKLGLAVRDAVKSRAYLSGADLSGADLSGANLSGAYLSGADLSGGNLSGACLSGANLLRAYLSGADLSGGNLSGADLSGAYLSRADLSGANLSGANLSGAKGYTPERCVALASLPYMTGPIQAFKLVNAKGEGHVNGGIKYPVGEVVTDQKANTDPSAQCAAGLNVADLPWVLRNWVESYRILLVEFMAQDIAAIPHGTDGKFRLHRLTVIKDITDDLRANGVLPAIKK